MDNKVPTDNDPLKMQVLPKSYVTLGLTHHSPTQASLPDGVHLFKYGVLTQEQRRMLPSNPQMKAGVLVNNVLQKHMADTIWKFGPQRKLQKSTNNLKGKSVSSILKLELDEYKTFQPANEKEQAKFEKYQDEVADVVNNAFQSLEKIRSEHLYHTTCEEQISLTQDKTELLCPIVGRTDFTFQKDGYPLPSRIVELKTSWSKLGRLKKDGTRSFIVSTAPSAPSYNHLQQCAFYAAHYNFEVPVSLVYVTAKGCNVFDESNCLDLTKEYLYKHFLNMRNVFRRREKIYGLFENLPKDQMVKEIAGLVDPNWDHPWCWHGMPDEFLRQAKELWKVN